MSQHETELRHLALVTRLRDDVLFGERVSPPGKGQAYFADQDFGARERKIKNNEIVWLGWFSVRTGWDGLFGTDLTLFFPAHACFELVSQCRVSTK